MHYHLANLLVQFGQWQMLASSAAAPHLITVAVELHCNMMQNGRFVVILLKLPRSFFFNPLLRRPTPQSMFDFLLQSSTPRNVHGYATPHILHDVKPCWFGVSLGLQSYLAGLGVRRHTLPFYYLWVRLW